jgi:hypothetical protein
VDHISLLSQEKQFKSWYETIEHYSTEYCRKQMSKHWGFTVVNIQQQASDKEKQQYTVKGDSIEDKLEPSLDGLGDNSGRVILKKGSQYFNSSASDIASSWSADISNRVSSASSRPLTNFLYVLLCDKFVGIDEFYLNAKIDVSLANNYRKLTRS